MKFIKLFLFLLGTSLLMTSCYKESNWLDENSTTDGNYYPVIQKMTVEAPNENAMEGDSVNITTYYWSKDPIKELQFFVDDNLTTTWAHTDSFDEEAYAQKTSFLYIVPSLPDSTTVNFLVKVINENGLEKEKATSILVIK